MSLLVGSLDGSKSVTNAYNENAIDAANVIMELHAKNFDVKPVLCKNTVWDVFKDA